MEKGKRVEALEVLPGEKMLMPKLPKLLMNRVAGAQWLQGHQVQQVVSCGEGDSTALPGKAQQR